MGLPLKYAYCVKCNDGILKPCIGKRENALCDAKHYWPQHRASQSRKLLDKIYNKRRLVYLKLFPECQLHLVEDCCHTATEIHHTKGRDEYYLIEETWLSSCWKCHRRANDHSDEAYAAGVSQLRLTNSN